MDVILILLSKWSMRIWQRQVQRWSRCTMDLGWLLEAWQSWVHSVKLSGQKSFSWYISELSLEAKIRTQAAFLVYLFISTSLEFAYLLCPAHVVLCFAEKAKSCWCVCVFRHFGFLPFFLPPSHAWVVIWDLIRKGTIQPPYSLHLPTHQFNLLAVSKLLTLHRCLTELSKSLLLLSLW